jgi:hypothetical protein
MILTFALPLAQALELGAISMAHVPAKPMASVAFSMSPAVFSTFARRVGGVAFTNTATSSDGSAIVGIAYRPDAADGARLQVSVRTADGKTSLHPLQVADWIHVPLARLVATSDTGAVTLFGELEDSEQQRALRDQEDAMIANYHPKLVDTLLGLRLLQADMLIIEENATDLFKDKGSYILGYGEPKPTQDDLRRNATGFSAVRGWMKRQPEAFVSYVTGDVGSKITYAVKGGKLVVKGNPTWHCWRFNTDEQDKTLMQYARKLSPDAYVAFSLAELQERIGKALDKVARQARQKGTSGQQANEDEAAIHGIAAVYSDTAADILAVSKGRPLTIIDRTQLEKAHAQDDAGALVDLFSAADTKVERMIKQDSANFQKIRQEIAAMYKSARPALDKISVIQMPKYSSALSAEIRKQGGVNPVVFETLQKSVQVAALLRAAKASNPEAYQRYVSSLATVPLKFTSPAAGYVLRTPTVYPRAKPEPRS